MRLSKENNRRKTAGLREGGEARQPVKFSNHEWTRIHTNQKNENHIYNLICINCISHC